MRKEDNLSPIEQIRHAEAEIIRQVATAREAAEECLKAAKIKAERLQSEAILEGKQEGEKLYQQTIDQAREAAARIVDQANKQANEMRENGKLNMGLVIQQALHYTLDMQTDQAEEDEH